jgi:hypothetical protein
VRQGRAEVDYICGRDDLDPQRYTVLPVESWRSLPKAMTHLGIGIEYLPLPTTAQHILSSLQRPGRRWKDPVYCDRDSWAKVANCIQEELKNVLPTLYSSSTSADQAHDALLGAITAALDKAIPAAPRHCRAHLSTGSSAAAFANRAAWDRIKAARPKALFPPAIATMLKKYKDLLAQYSQELGKNLDRSLLRRRVKQARKALSRALRRHRQQAVQELALKLSTMRKKDASGFFKQLQSRFAPEVPHLHAGDIKHIPSEPSHHPAMQRFAEHFKELFGNMPDLPPGATDESWLKFVPKLSEEAELSRPFSVHELMAAVFPVDLGSPFLCPATGKSESSCKICADKQELKENYTGRNDLHNAPPHNAPRLKTSSSYSGSPPLQAKHLSWSRPEDSSALRAYRLFVCDCLAAVVNKALSEQHMPEGSCVYNFVPLLKQSKSGSIPNKADPNNYRYIAISPLFTRLMGVLISARITHWSQLRDIVPVKHQGAFIPLLGTDWHVWALIEAIKAEWRCDRDVYLLFLDLKKAYDMVHPEALFIILRRCGCPEGLIGLLRHWSQSRVAQLRINGEASASIPVTMGTGQGDTPSCILFDIFIASLARYLDSIPGVGIKPAGVRIGPQLFADDGEVPNNSPGAHQETASACFRWCKAWGMLLGVAVDKTAGMVLYCPASLRRGDQFSNFPPPAVLPDGRVIPWVVRYKYLGFSMTPLLSMDQMVNSLKGRMLGEYLRYFGYNSVLDASDPTTRTQVFMATSVGAINYLLCLLPITTDVLDRIDSTIHQAARSFLGLHRAAPTMLAMLETGLPTARELLHRARYQLYEALRCTPFKEAPAPSLFRALSPLPLYGTIGTPTESWVHSTRMLFQKAVSAGAVMPVTLRRAQAAPNSTVAARSVAVTDLQAEVARGGYSTNVTRSDQRPAPGPPTQHFIDLGFGFTAPAGALGLNKLATPLSVRLPGGDGCGLSLISKPISRELISLLAMARLGALALHLPPMAPMSWLLPEGASAELWRASSHGSFCPFCPSLVADTWHILNVCTHPKVVRAREKLRAQTSAYVPQLIYHIDRAALGYACSDAVHHLAGRCATAFDWGTPTDHFILFRLCLMLPWPASCVPPGELSFASLFGELMDATVLPTNRLRRIYNSWAPWAGARTRSIVGVWARAVDALTGFPPRGYGRLLLRSVAMQGQAPRRVPHRLHPLV